MGQTKGENPVTGNYLTNQCIVNRIEQTDMRVNNIYKMYVST